MGAEKPDLSRVIPPRAGNEDESMKEIGASTALYGLIGHPVGHSLSPQIHNTLAEYTGMDLCYTVFDVESRERLGDAVRGAHALGIGGLNVTVPYKKDVFPYLADIDPIAERIGAVNTLVRCEGGYKGYNTDYMGLRRALEECGVDVTARDAAVIGAGGAARAAVFMYAAACEDRGAKGRTLFIINRTREKAEALSHEVQEGFASVNVRVLGLDEAAGIASMTDGKILAMQCTSAGLYPDVNSSPITDPGFFKNVGFAFDAVYKPARTRFMQLAAEQGAGCANGLSMLLWQGICAYSLWTGKDPGPEAVSAVRRKLEDAQR